MVTCRGVVSAIFKYETTKKLFIHSLLVGVISRLVQLIILAYIIGYVIVYKKGYQDFSEVQSSVTTKVKGTVYTNFSHDDFNEGIKHQELYNRIWDVVDYVVPPSENGALFVTTNVIITANQKKGICAEDVSVPGAVCDPANNTCVVGKRLIAGNGVMTGNCINDTQMTNYTCEIHAWCPVEYDELPLKNNQAVLGDSEDFTLLIKNFVNFPKFKNSQRRNIKDTSNKTYLQSCLYDSKDNIDCPIFRLGDIVSWAGQNYSDLAYKGGVMAIVMNWDCNFDWSKNICFPTYSFTRLDDPGAKLAPGWNFRYAHFYDDNSRTMYKLYGIKFNIIVQGQAGKFNIIPLLLNVGAGLGLLALQVIICDIVVLYLMKGRNYYYEKKYEHAAEAEKEEFIVAPPIHEVSSEPLPTRPYNTYERLTD